MSQTAYILAGITYYIVSIIVIVIVLNLINKREKKKYQNEIIALERDKNLIISSSILSELNKVEALVNNEKMQETFEDWQKRFKEIKDVALKSLKQKFPIKLQQSSLVILQSIQLHPNIYL